MSSGSIPVFGNFGEVAETTVDATKDLGVEVMVDVAVEMDDGVDAGGGTKHVALVMIFASNVTAPLRANTRPSTFVPVVRVADVKARIFPLKVEFVPSVAELPTCQKTLQAWAEFKRATLLVPEVISVELVLKTKTALGSPAASSVRVPVIWNVPAMESYTPADLIVPPSSVGTVETGVCPAALV